MSRRLIFIITAFVVLLYFTVILFILRPLHGRGGGNGGYLNGFAFREIPSLNWCKALRWRTPPGPPTALVSFPGSGNTWLRYLLQQATGILTGSIYMDYGLRVHGFPAENVTDGSVLLVKTHGNPPDDVEKFKSAVLLIRDPKDAILADFNRLHKGHIGTAPKSAFKHKKDGRNTDWSNYFKTQLPVWERLHRQWLENFQGPIHIVQYEQLVSDTRGTLRGILAFLNYNVTEEDMNCAMYNREGIYRRRRRVGGDPYTPPMHAALAAARLRHAALLREYTDRGMLPVTTSK